MTSSASSSIVSSPLEHPAVSALMDQLYAIAKGKISLAISKVRELALVLSTIDKLEPSLAGRVQFLGRNLLHELAGEKVINDLSATEATLVSCCNMKNALQVEAVYYGAISRTFDIHLNLSMIPQLHELWTEMPFMFKNIIHDQRMIDSFRIKLAPLNEYFSRFDFDALPERFDTTMLQIFQQYDVIGDELIVPIGSLPPVDFLEAYMGSSDFHSKLMAQMLYFCALEERVLFGAHSSKFLSQQLLTSITKQPFDFYLPKKQLIPLFCHFVEASMATKAEGQPVDSILFDESFLRRDRELKGESWLEESACVFDLIHKIELGVRKIFKPGFLGPLDEILQAEGCDQKVIVWTNVFIHPHIHTDIVYPIKKEHPFASDKAAFKLLPLPQFMDACHERAKAIRELEAVKALKKASKGKKAPPAKPAKAASAGGASAAASAAAVEVVSSKAIILGSFTEDSEEEDELDYSVFCHTKAFASGGGGGASGGASIHAASKIKTPSSPKMAALTASLAAAEHYVKTLRFHRRVLAWQHSKESGLEYYHFGCEGVTHELSAEEMTLRHRLPQDLLLLALNPHFSIKKPITLSAKEVIENHYETCLTIDGKKYILEVSINADGTLFHYYARRVRLINDYQKMLSFYSADSKGTIAAELHDGASSAGSSGLEGFNAGSISFDAHGNARCAFEGHIYQIPVIKPLVIRE
jgi:hypothetical protein